MELSTVEKITKVPSANEARIAIENVLSATDATAIDDGQLTHPELVVNATREEKTRVTHALLEAIEDQLIERVIPGINQRREYMDRFRDLDEKNPEFRSRIDAIKRYLLNEHNQKYRAPERQELPDWHFERKTEDAKRCLAAENCLLKMWPTAEAWLQEWPVIEAREKEADTPINRKWAHLGSLRPSSPWIRAFELLYESLELKNPSSSSHGQWESWPPAAIIVREKTHFTRYLIVGLYLYGPENSLLRKALKSYIAK